MRARNRWRPSSAYLTAPGGVLRSSHNPDSCPQHHTSCSYTVYRGPRMSLPEISRATDPKAWPNLTRKATPTVRRGGRSGSAWSLPAADKMTRQPQDGSMSVPSHLVDIASRLRSNPFNEPEDARLTGGTRTLDRRLLGLNVTASSRRGPTGVGEPKRTQIA